MNREYNGLHPARPPANELLQGM